MFGLPYSDLTATAGVDYHPSSSSSIPINTGMGGGSGQLVLIPTSADSLEEGIETFQLSVQVLGQPQTAVILTARILDPGTTGGGGGGEEDGPIVFTASVQPAYEGSPVVLYLAAPEMVTLQVAASNVSALLGTDYSLPADTIVTVGPGAPARLEFPTTDNAVHYHTKSFKIVASVYADQESQLELEADIFDNDLPYATTQTVSYAYDVFDRLVRRTEDADGGGPTATADRFFSWENSQIALQFDRAAGQSTASLSHRYLYGPAVDQILADESVSSLTAPGSVIWPLADHLGTPRDLAVYNAATGETTIANHRFYDAFGNLISETNSTVDTLFGFTAGPYDETTGFTYRHHRWYVSANGIWASEDPISFFGGDANLYRYVANSPASFVDPSGLAGIGTINHVYPLYLGGAPDGVGYGFPSPANHQAFHDYLNEHGFSKYDPDNARAAWMKLTAAQRMAHLANAMRAGGATEEWIKLNMSDVMKGAKAGVNRSPDRKQPKVRPDVECPPKLGSRRVGGASESLLRRLTRKGKGALPLCTGLAFSGSFLPGQVEAKGPVGAAVDEALDSVPFLEWFKAYTETISGYDWIPDHGKDSLWTAPSSDEFSFLDFPQG